MKKLSKIFFSISILSFIGVLTLGGWWLFLIVKLSTSPEVTITSNIINLAKWEGGTFLLLLSTLTISFYYLYYKDLKKTKSLQTFFSGLTHELKTPLASIRLQSEVLGEKLEKIESAKTETKLLDRLIEDTQTLETQMDKIIQLSRVERDSQLNMQPLSIKDELKRIISNHSSDLSIEVNGLKDIKIFADRFALELVFKNLFENTRHHTNSEEVIISLSETSEMIKVNYNDSGIFKGNEKKLGKLFYTHHQTRGSGIGLYLSKKLIKLMKGKMEITATPNFSVSIQLPIQGTLS